MTDYLFCFPKQFLSFEFILHLRVQIEWLECLSVSFVELVLEFHPMQSERMQEALHRVHHDENTQSADTEYREREHSHNDAPALNAGQQSHFQEHLILDLVFNQILL